jgi:hypothetical protein
MHPSTKVTVNIHNVLQRSDRASGHFWPIAAFHSLFKLLQCGPSLRPIEHHAAFCRLKCRSVAKEPIRCAAETARILADFFTRPMFMHVITGHARARRCFEPVVGAGPTWKQGPESARQPAFATIVVGARPAFPIRRRARLFRAQMSQA